MSFLDVGISGQPADGSSPAQTILKLRQALSSYQQLLEDSEKTVSRLQDARLEQDKQVRTAQRKVARLEADNTYYFKYFSKIKLTLFVNKHVNLIFEKC